MKIWGPTDPRTGDTWISFPFLLCPDRVQTLPVAVAVYSQEKQRLSIRKMNHSRVKQKPCSVIPV